MARASCSARGLWRSPCAAEGPACDCQLADSVRVALTGDWRQQDGALRRLVRGSGVNRDGMAIAPWRYGWAGRSGRTLRASQAAKGRRGREIGPSLSFSAGRETGEANAASSW